MTGSKSVAMKKKGKGLFLPCPEEAAVIWILQIIYFFILTNELENWERGWGKKKLQFKWWQGGCTKPKDVFEEKVLNIGRSS